MRRFCLLAAFVVAFLTFIQMANAKQWPAVGLTGSCPGDTLDCIDTSDADLDVTDGDIARVWNDSGTAGWFLIYHFIAGDSTAESVPTVIAPNTGTGRWHLDVDSYKTCVFSVENPTSSENYGNFRFLHSGTITSVNGTLRGSGGQSVTIQLRHHSDRSSGAANNVFSAPTAITSVTTGDTPAIDGTDTFSVDDAFWLTTAAKAGTVNSLEVNVRFVYH